MHTYTSRTSAPWWILYFYTPVPFAVAPINTDPIQFTLLSELKDTPKFSLTAFSVTYPTSVNWYRDQNSISNGGSYTISPVFEDTMTLKYTSTLTVQGWQWLGTYRCQLADGQGVRTNSELLVQSENMIHYQCRYSYNYYIGAWILQQWRQKRYMQANQFIPLFPWHYNSRVNPYKVEWYNNRRSVQFQDQSYIVGFPIMLLSDFHFTSKSELQQ